MYIFHKKVKVGDPKVPFSTATRPRVGEGTTPFPGLLNFTLDMYPIMLSVC